MRNKLQSTLVNAFKDVLTVAQQHRVNMCVAAYMNAIRVAEAMFLRKPKTFMPVASPYGIGGK